ncbi:hypothetical protein N7532_008803 [Penicillium argentinense]|uniref:Uncharacterized protein n=1 Tax=Penicillium argentinense TaxID=1131581 RepID=A0A9W9K1X7_9EURO|nr:uncharacterized protein N7532_008803 [Penicillium argentinense]KAJ5090119.1 hypothetical protein N7532_008803 [Penicillium argentinense]
MDTSEILRTIASLNTRAIQAERTAARYEQELARVQQSLVKKENDLEEAVRMAEILYELNRKLGSVTDYLLKQQERLDDTDCSSFEAMFNILLKEVETHEVRPDGEASSNSDKQGRAGHPDGISSLG